MKKPRYLELEGRSTGFFVLLAILLAFIATGAGAFLYMEHNGHWVTGMNNQIVWGMPHVFAVFLIVAASGALNIASISSVFNRKLYKPLAPLSAILAVALLLGGLLILVLDLGRPERLIIAMTYYNPKSIFAWNILLYNGFFAIVLVYLWMMLERRFNKYSSIAGMFAFLWRLILTTGTGSIFGFLVARSSFDSAILAPSFVVFSFAYGLAIFALIVMAAYSWTGRTLGDALVKRMRTLLGVFVAGSLYFVVVFHLTNLYFTKEHGFEKFILAGDTYFTKLFWYGEILVGGIIPLFLVFFKGCNTRRSLIVASILVILGGFAQMFVTIIGGQAYPLPIFPGKIVESTFYDGIVNLYTPSLPEILLGLGGVAVAIFVVIFAMKNLRLLPESLADEEIDPHYSPAAEAKSAA
ncbi:MAG: molybdopterin oxidoreductase [Gammaproteobacteria bacterium]|nr:molybdopterin oxidoreductase [Gammaproteobacteria bacterium]